MPPRTGRPTDDPKRAVYQLRLSQSYIDKLKYCEQKTNLSRADILRMGIDAVYNSLVVESKGGNRKED